MSVCCRLFQVDGAERSAAAALPLPAYGGPALLPAAPRRRRTAPLLPPPHQLSCGRDPPQKHLKPFLPDTWAKATPLLHYSCMSRCTYLSSRQEGVCKYCSFMAPPLLPAAGQSSFSCCGLKLHRRCVTDVFSLFKRSFTGNSSHSQLTGLVGEGLQRGGHPIWFCWFCRSDGRSSSSNVQIAFSQDCFCLFIYCCPPPPTANRRGSAHSCLNTPGVGDAAHPCGGDGRQGAEPFPMMAQISHLDANVSAVMSSGCGAPPIPVFGFTDDLFLP